MDAVTYPNPAVKEVLERHYRRIVVHVEKDDISPTIFGVAAAPTSVALKADGTELQRFEGFVEPKMYAEQLLAAVSR